MFYVRVNVCMCASVVYVRVYVCICMCASVCVCMCMCVRLCVSRVQRMGVEQPASEGPFLAAESVRDRMMRALSRTTLLDPDDGGSVGQRRCDGGRGVRRVVVIVVAAVGSRGGASGQGRVVVCGCACFAMKRACWMRLVCAWWWMTPRLAHLFTRVAPSPPPPPPSHTPHAFSHAPPHCSGPELRQYAGPSAVAHRRSSFVRPQEALALVDSIAVSDHQRALLAAEVRARRLGGINCTHLAIVPPYPPSPPSQHSSVVSFGSTAPAGLAFPPPHPPLFRRSPPFPFQAESRAVEAEAAIPSLFWSQINKRSSLMTLLTGGARKQASASVSSELERAAVRIQVC
jgi:hypothetical protein